MGRKMNEKIKQLKEQATKIVETTDHCSGASESHAEVDLEKFAELIVKEALQVARAGIEYGPNMEEVVYKYFGVEE